ncbi:hypothetical protein TRVA0_011S03070 [Trichomonascus vanleenenianus]|uniref:aminopeptidase Y n=1 Tax=Trichomonascus vanleenenianus TaxID=2268995 RepID=UPI003ECA9B07
MKLSQVTPLFVGGLAVGFPLQSVFQTVENLVSSPKLQDHITEDALRSRAERLFEIAQTSEEKYGHPTRVIGSPGHLNTLKYIIDTLEQLGVYDVWTQKFEAAVGSIKESKVTVNSEPLAAEPMSMSPPADVTGKLFVARNDGCDFDDYDGAQGKIAIAIRGTCAFGDKSALAGKANASALFIYNNVGGNSSFSGTLGTPKDTHVATFGLSENDGRELINKAGEVEISIHLDSSVGNYETHNVLAQTKSGDPKNVVMLGAHSDSVTAGPGINDDGSGTNSLLEVATHLAKYNVSNAVRFAWWSAEEEGLLGSDHYVSTLSQEENLKIRLFMDYDMMASPNYAYQIYDANNIDNPDGSGELKQLYVDFYKSVGVNYTFIPFDGRSDYDGFIKNGIPGGGVATGAEELKTAEEAEKFGGTAGIQLDPCYHELCDNRDNLAYDAWVINTKLIAHATATYATSFKGFPKRRAALSAADASLKFSYHGAKLIV